MAQTAPPLRNRLMGFLDSDGQPHPLENTLAALTMVLGSVAVATAFFPGLHMVSSWVGLVGIAVAGYAQYISATTAERFVIVVFGGAAAAGLGIGLAHGGLI